jgi:hypothetical protein
MICKKKILRNAECTPPHPTPDATQYTSNPSAPALAPITLHLSHSLCRRLKVLDDKALPTSRADSSFVSPLCFTKIYIITTIFIDRTYLPTTHTICIILFIKLTLLSV